MRFVQRAVYVPEEVERGSEQRATARVSRSVIYHNGEGMKYKEQATMSTRNKKTDAMGKRGEMRNKARIRKIKRLFSNNKTRQKSQDPKPD